MADVELRSDQPAHEAGVGGDAAPYVASDAGTIKSRHWLARLLITLATVAVAALLGWAMWNAYMASPWTRDGAVRAYVVTIAPEVPGRIVQLPLVDNQIVHKGDLLMVIDPSDYAIAVDLAEAAVTQARANADNATLEARRRAQLTTLETSEEEKQTYASNAQATEATYQQAVAKLAQARVNLQRTNIHSPVNGYVTNLLARLGDYANVGQTRVSLVDADSYWIDGYFEETNLEAIQLCDPANIKLMGYRQIVHGHVDSFARGINVANAQADQTGLASVNPIFTWVRLAQRVPVRIHIDQVPNGVQLVQGMTATVEVRHRDGSARYQDDNPRALPSDVQDGARCGGGSNLPEKGTSFPDAGPGTRGAS
jgi:multidrug resistance efflux pump